MGVTIGNPDERLFCTSDSVGKKVHYCFAQSLDLFPIDKFASKNTLLSRILTPSIHKISVKLPRFSCVKNKKYVGDKRSMCWGIMYHVTQ